MTVHRKFVEIFILDCVSGTLETVDKCADDPPGTEHLAKSLYVGTKHRTVRTTSDLRARTQTVPHKVCLPRVGKRTSGGSAQPPGVLEPDPGGDTVNIT